mmetsp:Transcript_24052/g.33721  ORF Transcript_24052/g.33721 Transcript_24052/m.33721 type:complete len:213 (+) Transcript_24052:97-735(+)
MDEAQNSSPADAFSKFAKPTENVDQKLETAAKEKEEGNKSFKAGDHKKAVYYYHRALLYVNGMNGLSFWQTKTMNEIKVACNNNMAACYLKEEKWNKAIQCCTQVLNIEKENVKALFRRGKAYIAVKDLDKAEADLKKAQSLDPNDKAITKELQIIHHKNKQAEQKQKQFYSKLFEKAANEEIYSDKKIEPEKPKNPEDDDVEPVAPQDDDQ